MSCSLQHTGSQPRARGVAASASDLASNLAPVAQGGAGLEAMQKADKRGTILHIFPLQVRLLYLLPLFIRYVSLRCELITAAPSSLPCPWAPPRTVWGAGASLERLLGTCAPKPWIHGSGLADPRVNGPSLVTTTQGDQTCRERLADASETYNWP